MNELIGYEPFAAYAARPGCNWSTVRAMAVSPLHYRAACVGSYTPTDAMIEGGALHTMLFEPHTLPARYAPWYEDRRGEVWREFAAEAAALGRQTIRGRAYDACLAAADAVRSHPLVAPYLDGARGEMTIVWTDRDTGLDCKSRLDCVGGGAIVELKRTHDISPHAFSRICMKYGYHGQLAFQAMGWHAITGELLPLRIIAVEATDPHDVAVYRLEQRIALAGEELAQRLLRAIARCQQTGAWPGQFAAEASLELPQWAAADAALDARTEEMLTEAYR
ncbi:MAG: PD-(D/E)XK nuclease-like domain-containing protein [Burkholderiales bacterium]|nr:PD-(D/E)XK nuclease-like domain-containing protein [Burkholderiales bacterium]